MTRDNGDYVRSYYQVPAYKDDEVIVDGRPGRIVGFDGQYLVVKFDHITGPMRAHPKWNVSYVGADARARRDHVHVDILRGPVPGIVPTDTTGEDR